MKILFLASSRSQAQQYKEICKVTGWDGIVLNIKHPGFGNWFLAVKWLITNRGRYRGWVEYQKKKNHIRKIKNNFFRDILYVWKMIGALGAVITKLSKNKLEAAYLRNGLSYTQQAVLEWLRQHDIKIIYTENGQLPNSFVIDTSGVNNNSSVPRDSGFYQALKVPAGYSCRKRLVARNNKYIEGSITLPKNYYFVPFQVPTDSQVLLNSPWIDSMEIFYELLESSVSYLPENIFFVVKEHPSSWIRYSNLHKLNDKIVFANGNDTQELIENSLAVITLNSSVGVESLMLGKPVITLGESCYNIDGLVTHVSSQQELIKVLSCPDTLLFNKELVRKFLWWLDDCYLLKGKLREFHLDEQLVAHFKERVTKIIQSEYKL